MVIMQEQEYHGTQEHGPHAYFLITEHVTGKKHMHAHPEQSHTPPCCSVFTMANEKSWRFIYSRWENDDT